VRPKSGEGRVLQRVRRTYVLDGGRDIKNSADPNPEIREETNPACCRDGEGLGRGNRRPSGNVAEKKVGRRSTRRLPRSICPTLLGRQRWGGGSAGMTFVVSEC